MNRNVHIVLFLFAVLLLVGCLPTRSYVSFEILEPSPVSYSSYVKNIAFLNKAPISKASFARVNQSGLEDYNSIYMIDTLICNHVLKGFEEAKAVNEQLYYNYAPYLTFRKRDTSRRENPLTAIAHRSFFDSYKIDAMISLEYYNVRIDKSSMRYDFETGRYFEEYKLELELFWRIYEKEQLEPIDEYRQFDTMYYVNHSEMTADEYLGTSNILKDGSAEFGYRYGLRLIPLWNEVSRVVFVGGDESLKSSATYTNKGEWELAKSLWMKESASEDVKLAAKSLHNLAVYFELEDQMDSAFYYSEKAAGLWENTYILEYNNEIGIRLKNKSDLLKQVR